MEREKEAFGAIYCANVDEFSLTHIYIFFVVNFDALSQASDFRIERTQLVLLC